jgi:colicin import membrane protein
MTYAAAVVAALLSSQAQAQAPSRTPPPRDAVQTIAIPERQTGAEEPGQQGEAATRARVPDEREASAPPATGAPAPRAATPEGGSPTAAAEPATPAAAGIARPESSSPAPGGEASLEADRQEAIREEQIRLDAQALADAQSAARAEQLQLEIEALRDEVDAQRARAEALEQRLQAREAEEARRAAEAAESTLARAESTAAALGDLDTAMRALETGDPRGLDAALASQADALEATRGEAQRQGALAEAAGTGASATHLAEAREALARGDLFTARLALVRATLAARGAHTLAREGAGAAGATTGTGAGY